MLNRIDQSFCWYNNKSMIVKMYFINNIPFTFDELPDDHLSDYELVEIADKERSYEPDDIYKNSYYLICEEAHPLLFDVELENPEDLPEDIYFQEEEDLTS